MMQETEPFCPRGRHRRRRQQRRIGRPMVEPNIKGDWEKREDKTILRIGLEGIEALRLVDQEGLTQEEAAEKMQVSRGTLWRYINRARQNIIEALLRGKVIEVRICEGECIDCPVIELENVDQANP